MGASEVVGLVAAVAAVLGVLGGVLRYLVQMARTMERSSTQAALMGEAFQRHVSSSDELHRALTDRVSVHGEQLAALTARVDGMAR